MAPVQILFPELEYCLNCWKRLDPRQTLVIRRRWCSYECAKMRAPHPDPARWPRECLTKKGYPKARYTHPEAVDASGTMHTYECGYCGYFHIGHKPFDVQKRR